MPTPGRRAPASVQLVGRGRGAGDGDRAGLVVDDLPVAVLADENVGRDQHPLGQDFVAGDEAGFAQDMGASIAAAAIAAAQGAMSPTSWPPWETITIT